MSLIASTKMVLENRPLGAEVAWELYCRAELGTLGCLADEVRRRRHPEGIVTYIIDRNINPTNVCITDCGFCAFYRRPGDPEAYVLPREEIYRKIDELRAQGGIQVLLQGGHHHELGTEWFEKLFRDIKERYPDLWIHGLSPPEIHHLSKLDRISVAEVIRRLRAAGLDSIPGGGAEILVDRVRRIIAPKKASTEEWLEVMRQAALQGLRGSATMMFGHFETPRERITHLVRIRDLQEETGGFFTSFIPWTFQPDHTPIEEAWARNRVKATKAEYLRLLALSRIFLHNFDHVQTSWVTQGLKTCQVGLSMGADDVGSMMLEENVVSSAGCNHMTSIHDVESMIQDAGFTPRRRNMRFDLLPVVELPKKGRRRAEGAP